MPIACLNKLNKTLTLLCSFYIASAFFCNKKGPNIVHLKSDGSNPKPPAISEDISVEIPPPSKEEILEKAAKVYKAYKGDCLEIDRGLQRSDSSNSSHASYANDTNHTHQAGKTPGTSGAEGEEKDKKAEDGEDEDPASETAPSHNNNIDNEIQLIELLLKAFKKCEDMARIAKEASMQIISYEASKHSLVPTCVSDIEQMAYTMRLSLRKYLWQQYRRACSLQDNTRRDVLNITKQTTLFFQNKINNAAYIEILLKFIEYYQITLMVKNYNPTTGECITTDCTINQENLTQENMLKYINHISVSGDTLSTVCITIQLKGAAAYLPAIEDIKRQVDALSLLDTTISADALKMKKQLATITDSFKHILGVYNDTNSSTTKLIITSSKNSPSPLINEAQASLQDFEHKKNMFIACINQLHESIFHQLPTENSLFNLSSKFLLMVMQQVVDLIPTVNQLENIAKKAQDPHTASDVRGITEAIALQAGEDLNLSLEQALTKVSALEQAFNKQQQQIAQDIAQVVCPLMDSQSRSSSALQACYAALYAILNRYQIQGKIIVAVQNGNTRTVLEINNDTLTQSNLEQLYNAITARNPQAITDGSGRTWSSNPVQISVGIIPKDADKLGQKVNATIDQLNRLTGAQLLSLACNTNYAIDAHKQLAILEAETQGAPMDHQTSAEQPSSVNRKPNTNTNLNKQRWNKTINLMKRYIQAYKNMLTYRELVPVPNYENLIPDAAYIYQSFKDRHARCIELSEELSRYLSKSACSYQTNHYLTQATELLIASVKTIGDVDKLQAIAHEVPPHTAYSDVIESRTIAYNACMSTTLLLDEQYNNALALQQACSKQQQQTAEDIAQALSPLMHKSINSSALQASYAALMEVANRAKAQGYTIIFCLEDVEPTQNQDIRTIVDLALATPDSIKWFINAIFNPNGSLKFKVSVNVTGADRLTNTIDDTINSLNQLTDAQPLAYSERKAILSASTATETQNRFAGQWGKTPAFNTGRADIRSLQTQVLRITKPLKKITKKKHFSISNQGIRHLHLRDIYLKEFAATQPTQLASLQQDPDNTALNQGYFDYIRQLSGHLFKSNLYTVKCIGKELQFYLSDKLHRLPSTQHPVETILLEVFNLLENKINNLANDALDALQKAIPEDIKDTPVAIRAKRLALLACMKQRKQINDETAKLNRITDHTKVFATNLIKIQNFRTIGETLNSKIQKTTDRSTLASIQKCHTAVLEAIKDTLEKLKPLAEKVAQLPHTERRLFIKNLDDIKKQSNNQDVYKLASEFRTTIQSLYMFNPKSMDTQSAPSTPAAARNRSGSTCHPELAAKIPPKVPKRVASRDPEARYDDARTPDLTRQRSNSEGNTNLKGQAPLATEEQYRYNSEAPTYNPGTNGDTPPNNSTTVEDRYVVIEETSTIVVIETSTLESEPPYDRSSHRKIVENHTKAIKDIISWNRKIQNPTHKPSIKHAWPLRDRKKKKLEQKTKINHLKQQLNTLMADINYTIEVNASDFSFLDNLFNKYSQAEMNALYRNDTNTRPIFKEISEKINGFMKRRGLSI